MSRTIALGILLLWTGANVAPGAALKPSSVEQFFVEPQKPAVLQWRVESGELGEAIEYALRDYAGKAVGSGTAKRVGTGTIEARVQLDHGFYEIEFPATGQRFGIVALPAHGEKANPFFCIDGALSWLVKNAEIREGLVKAAHRSGIGMIRERLTWGGVHPAKDKWDWEGGARFDALRRTYQKHGVAVLEMAHDGPQWLGRVGKYPENLVGTASSWEQIARHWRPAWGALEVWNEPDIFFGGDLPADQYVALAKAISLGLAEAKADVPVVGGVMAHCNQAFLDSSAQNGLLDYIDAFSFHTYGRAPEMESLVAKYRRWLRENKKGNMPLWITECGQPWQVGPDRPPVDQDAASAVDIAMKAVEARACGIERYFAFVYPYYEENKNNFGMMDKRATPLRSMAAYAQMIHALAGQPYLGDWKLNDSAIQRARVFGNDRRAVAVLYTGRVDPQAKVKLNVPVLRIEGIDGRVLPQPTDGTIPIPDGLAYVWLKGLDPADQLVRQTPAMQLHVQETPEQRQVVPVVMRYQYDAAWIAPSSEGYRIKPESPGEMPLTVRTFNLSDESWDLTFTLLGTTPAGPKRATVSPRSSVDVTWKTSLPLAFARADRVMVQVLASTGLRGMPSRLAMTFTGEAGLLPTLQRYSHWQRLPIQDRARWTPSIAGHATMTLDSTAEAPWRLQAKFKEKDRWVYPSFQLPETVKVDQNTGLVVRARCQKPATVRVFLWEGDKGVGYLTQKSIIPADGQWHVARVRFSDLILSNANAPDANGRLDLDQVRRISIGMNSDVAENTLEVSDVCAVKGE